MKKAKWFFPAQEKIKTYLTEKFGENYRCEFQDVNRYNVYENYTAWAGEGSKRKVFSIQFVMYRPSNINTSKPSLIRVYYERNEDTMQFFTKSIQGVYIS